MVVLGPHGTALGRRVYLGDPHSDHVYGSGWDMSHEWYSRTAVGFVCAMGYAAGVARMEEVGDTQRAWGRLGRAVMAVAAPFLLVWGIQLTRQAEIGKTEQTGWALWMAVPFVYAGISQ